MYEMFSHNIPKCENIFCRLLENQHRHLIDAVMYIKNDINFTCYPFMPSYSLTMPKSQGQTLSKVIIWFDSDKLSKGLGCAALSRIRCRSDLILIIPIKEVHVKPVIRRFSILYTWYGGRELPFAMKLYLKFFSQ